MVHKRYNPNMVHVLAVNQVSQHSVQHLRILASASRPLATDTQVKRPRSVNSLCNCTASPWLLVVVKHVLTCQNLQLQIYLEVTHCAQPRLSCEMIGPGHVVENSRNQMFDHYAQHQKSKRTIYCFFELKTN